MPARSQPRNVVRRRLRPIEADGRWYSCGEISTAAALGARLRKAQETKNFGIAQFTSSSCIPALNADMPDNPNCRAANDKVMAIVSRDQA